MQLYDAIQMAVLEGNQGHLFQGRRCSTWFLHHDVLKLGLTGHSHRLRGPPNMRTFGCGFLIHYCDMAVCAEWMGQDLQKWPL